jgi:hypothetical protein
MKYHLALIVQRSCGWDDTVPRQGRAIWLMLTHLHELDLAHLAELCGDIAHNHSVTHQQWETALALCVEWVRLSLNREVNERRNESLKKRMVEFLSGVPTWMLPGG